MLLGHWFSEEEKRYHMISSIRQALHSAFTAKDPLDAIASILNQTNSVGNGEWNVPSEYNKIPDEFKIEVDWEDKYDRTH